MNTRKPFRWWYALLIFVFANLVSALPVGFGGDFAFFNSFRQPSVAPPDWAFAPIWLFLNVTSLIAMYRVANSPSESRARSTFLMSEGLGWVLFAVFSTLYFLLRSPILGAADTLFGLMAGLVSFACARRVDRQASAYIGLRVLWLALASYVSVYMALYNADPFLGTSAALP